MEKRKEARQDLEEILQLIEMYRKFCRIKQER